MSFAKEGKTMIYNYYPGCTLSTKAKQLDMAARRCAEDAGLSAGGAAGMAVLRRGLPYGA